MSLSKEGRESVVAGQKRRWARYRDENPNFPCGHPRTEANTRSTRRKGRADTTQCRECELDRSREYWAEHKDEINARRRAMDAERRKASA